MSPTHEKPSDSIHELSWEQGNRMAWRMILGEAIRNLGIEDVAANQARWILEREAAVAQLREVCGEFGDNDWENNLHLADVIRKHLASHLESADRGMDLAVRNAINQLKAILPLVESSRNDHWPSSPPHLIEAAIGTLEEALAHDPLSAQ